MHVSPRVMAAIIVILAAGLLGLGIHHFTSGHDDPTTIAFEPADIPPDRERAIADATAADIGFLQDMSVHHGQAVLMSNHIVRHGENESVRNLALNILNDQAFEIGAMAAHLSDRGSTTGSPDREAMAWMGHPVPLDEMLGLVPQDDLNELLNTTGVEADRRFLELMLDHHVGGVEMAKWGATLASDPAVRDMAERMIVAQESEITDIQTLLGPER